MVEVVYKLVYILYSAGGCGGVKDAASTGIKNNVKPIMETPCKGVPICRKTEH